MQIIRTIVVAAVVGVLVGAAVAYVEVYSDPDAIDPLSNEFDSGSQAGSEKGLARLQVDEPRHDFGTMQRGTTKSHDFTIKNIGTAPLKVRLGSTTCKCTLSAITDESIPPGGTTTVKLEWTAKSDNGPFTQSATIITNDPSHYQFDLTVSGNVLAISGVEPPEFLFEKVAVDQIKSAQVFVMAMLQDEVTVKDPVFSDPTIRDKFDVKIEPVKREALPNKLARAGVRVTITSKPGLPIGRFNSWLSLRTSLSDAGKLDIPVVGEVVGDIGVRGIGGWNEEQGVLSIGSVKRSVGGRGKVSLVVRGAEAPRVEFKVLTKPAELNVTIGKPKKLSDTLVHVPVEIEIPPGTPPMIHLDTAQGEAARIVFSTTHSKIKEVALAVRFAVER